MRRNGLYGYLFLAIAGFVRSSGDVFSCPKECQCQRTSIDCSYRGLKKVPRNIPKVTRRLDLQGNNLTNIRKGDFDGLTKLRILQLLDNGLKHIDVGAFDDLIGMERLRLNRNKLSSLPDMLFAHMPRLYRLDLQGNNLTNIRKGDFDGLTKLRILQLLDNGLKHIDVGAFDDLIGMERLRLNRNKLSSLPDMLFAHMPRLYRLDLSWNLLTEIHRKSLKGAPLLRNLQIDNNRITCITDDALYDFKDMEILTINHNNMTSLPKDMFERMNKLRILRIADNALQCDCDLAWLPKWLRAHPTLALFTKCSGPELLKQQEIAELEVTDFKCNKESEQMKKTSCGPNYMCPTKCICHEGIVDCRNKGLTKLPRNIPLDVTELRLEQNNIEEIPSQAFIEFAKLRRVDMNNNKISKLKADAFDGLTNLNSLVLYGNLISELPENVFKGLSGLQLLLLNANRISCVRSDAFKDLHNLNLLSLYDNRIRSLANGTFGPLKNIQTLHLARNPFICDCNLRWLSEYLQVHPIETSGARCDTPRRLKRKKIGFIRHIRFRCTDSSPEREVGDCKAQEQCPEKCVCEGTMIDCSGKGLKDIPTTLPDYVTELKLSNNEISRVPGISIFKKLAKLNSIDLRNNRLEVIEDSAFMGATQLSDLDLSLNSLSALTPGMFHDLKNLKSLQLTNNKIACINNDTFVDLTELNVLSLYNNNIRCIQPGTFDRLKQLSNLKLQSNPFNCNCHMGWLSEYLRLHPAAEENGGPRCASPEGMKDVLLQDLRKNDFVCEVDKTLKPNMVCNLGPPPCCTKDMMDSEPDNCDPRAHCPSRCKCSGTAVRCSFQKLTEVPRDIPLDTTELYLDSNDITELPPELKRLKKLRRMDISNNRLTHLPDYAFANFPDMSTLILSFNKLRCVMAKTFAGLKQLRVLSLHANDLSSIPYGSFDDLTSLTHIALGNNPLYCDCNLKWLSDYIKTDYKEGAIADCIGPPKLKGQLLLTTASAKFQCGEEKPDEKILSKCNICYTYPCGPNGKCIFKSFNKYECECTSGYHGKNCELAIDACFGNPCGNGGTCQVFGKFGRFSCQCIRGFEGDRCETNIDDCIGHSCQHNSTCIDKVDAYKCLCRPGTTGAFCEKKFEFCQDFNPCSHNAKCTPAGNDYRCHCPSGYEGKNCSENYDDCQGNMCQNGAQCQDGLNSYKCLCPPGFSGRFCEILPIAPRFYPQTSVCMQHDCKNGGLCFQPPGSNEYICRCLPGFDGKKCEKMSAISFREPDSYVRLPALKVVPTANVTIILSSLKSQGVILYHGYDQHIAVELFRGRIRTSFDIGNYPVSTMFSYEQLADGKEHIVELLISGKNLTLQIDRHRPRTLTNEGDRPHLMLDKPLFLGGVPPDVQEAAYKKWHLRHTSSFNGCYKKVYINGRLIDFSTTDFTGSHSHYKVTPGCRAAAPTDNEDPCEDNKCENNSKCKKRMLTSSKYGFFSPKNAISKEAPYDCKCKRGYGGKYCEKAPTCHKIEYREIYVDPKTGCRSRVKVRHRRCSGGCGKYCCVPKKIKTRKIRMFCEDRPNYLGTVAVIRKCGCKKCS